MVRSHGCSHSARLLPQGVLGYSILPLRSLVALVGRSVMTASATSACAVMSVVRSAAMLMTFAGVLVVVWLPGLLPCAGQLLRKRLPHV